MSGFSGRAVRNNQQLGPKGMPNSASLEKPYTVYVTFSAVMALVSRNFGTLIGLLQVGLVCSCTRAIISNMSQAIATMVYAYRDHLLVHGVLQSPALSPSAQQGHHRGWTRGQNCHRFAHGRSHCLWRHSHAMYRSLYL
jgi:hypothetical protein